MTAPANQEPSKIPHSASSAWMIEIWEEVQQTQKALNQFSEEIKKIIPNLEAKFEEQQKSLKELRQKRIEIRQAEIKLIHAEGVEVRNNFKSEVEKAHKDIQASLALYKRTSEKLKTAKLIAALAIGFALGLVSTKIFAGENSHYQNCPELQPQGIFEKIVRQESAGNPYAIGVVNGSLIRQPKNVKEAVATAANLEALGRNYSVGQHQINKQHFKRYGWQLEDAFDACKNAKAGREIFNQCHADAKKAGYSDLESTKAALSCYYSGDFKRGTRLGYSDSVLAQPTAEKPPAVQNTLVIPLSASNANNSVVRKPNEKRQVKQSTNNETLYALGKL